MHNLTPAANPASNLVSDQPVWLYRFVFTHRGLRLFVLLLLAWLCLQPAFVVYANESDIAGDTTSAPVETEQIDETEAEVAATAPDTKPTSTTADESANEYEDSESTADETAADLPESEAVANTPTKEATSSDVHTAVATTTEATSTTATSTDAVATTSTTYTDEPATSSSRVTSATTDTGSTNRIDATSTPTAAAPAERQEQSVTNANYYQFSRDDCTRVADGSFYCGEVSVDRPETERFFVALDGDGDREIFAYLNNETVQITYNEHDDAAPYYDDASNTLVWHAQIRNHYQIMSYDFATEEITQLTDNSVNNMEPTRSGDNVVWQRWGAKSWDVMLHDGEEMTQLTDNEAPDIAPSVRDDVVVWKRVYNGEPVVVLYDLHTHSETEVSGEAADATVQNARMMLVYEGVTDSGERVVRGIDPETGKLIPIGAVPTPLPERVPASEPTDEVRALIQSKPDTEPEDVLPSQTANSGATGSSTRTQVATSSDATVPATSSSSTQAAPAVATTSDSTLVIPATPAATTSPSSTTSTDVASSSYDLVIPPTASSTSQ